MVKRATYYAKFSTNPSVNLSFYSGTYELRNGDNIILSGDMVKNTSDFELTIQTASLDLGKYRLVCFVVFPDGFIQNINDEEINIT